MGSVMSVPDNIKALGEFPEHEQVDGGRLVVCASGACVWSDFYELATPNKWEQNFDIMAVNDIGMHLPHRLKHWYSNDYTMLWSWYQARRPRFNVAGFPEDRADEQIQLHCCFEMSRALIWPWTGSGTSTLNACLTGLALGYEEVIICGAPLDDGPHYFDPPQAKTNFTRSGGFRQWQDARSRYFEGRVRSMSGNTKRILEGENLV